MKKYVNDTDDIIEVEGGFVLPGGKFRLNLDIGKSFDAITADNKLNKAAFKRVEILGMVKSAAIAEKSRDKILLSWVRVGLTVCQVLLAAILIGVLLLLLTSNANAFSLTEEPTDECVILSDGDFGQYGKCGPICAENEIYKANASGVFICAADAGAAGGDSVSIDGVDVVDPDFVSTGDIDFTDTANTVTADINDDKIKEVMLNATNTPGAGEDNYILSYNHAGLNFTWTIDAGGGDFLKDGSVPMEGTLQFADNQASRPELIDYSITCPAIGSDTTPDYDLATGNCFTDTIDTGETTPTFSNPPASGEKGSFTLIITNGNSQTINWPAAVTWAAGAQPTLETSGVDILYFFTVDAGTIWYGFKSSGSGVSVATADISDVDVEQTELEELETIGATVIEAADWTAVAAMSGVNTGDQVITDTKCGNIPPDATITNWLFYRTDVDITITGLDCLTDVATSSVVLTIRECDANGANCVDIEAAITCNTTNSTEAGGIDNAGIDAGDWIRVTRGTVTNDALQGALCMTFTVD